MLRHMNLLDDARRIENSVLKTIEKGGLDVLTRDLGGRGTCSGFTNEVIANL